MAFTVRGKSSRWLVKAFFDPAVRLIHNCAIFSCKHAREWLLLQSKFDLCAGNMASFENLSDESQVDLSSLIQFTEQHTGEQASPVPVTIGKVADQIKKLNEELLELRQANITAESSFSAAITLVRQWQPTMLSIYLTDCLIVSWYIRSRNCSDR